MGKNAPKLSLITAMCIFSTIGLLRKFIDLPSGAVALARAVIGTLFLMGLMLLRKQKLDTASIRKNGLLLLLSGGALGINWMLLFEAYNHTTVATATLCYYMAPALVILVSPFLFRERMTLRKGLCCAAAVVGIVLVSGVTHTGFSVADDLWGILLGLSAAVFYACVVSLNKKIEGIAPLSRTILQLAISSVFLLPYTLLGEDLSAVSLHTSEVLLLALAGILHTGVAYALYFDSIHALPAHTAALLSYIDPILAIVLSALLLREPIGPEVIGGAVLILGAAIVSEKKNS